MLKKAKSRRKSFIYPYNFVSCCESNFVFVSTMSLFKSILITSAMTLASTPLLAQTSTALTNIGKPTLLSQILTLLIACIFAGILITAVTKLFRENGIEKEDPYAKRIGCTGIFLIVLIAVILVSITATSYTGIRFEDNSKHFFNWVIDMLRRIF